MTQQAPPGVDFPGKTLGIVGLVVAIFFNLIGLIVSAIALGQSRRAGYKNTPALVGVIIGAIFTALAVIGVIIIIGISVAAVNAGYSS